MHSAETTTQPTVLRMFDDFMVVNKPAGWHTVRHEGSEGNTLEAWLCEHEPRAAALEEAGLCHRLDQWTSGCVAVALTLDAHTRLRQAFSQTGSGVRKVYLALVVAGLDHHGRFRLNFDNRYKRSAKVSVRESGDAWTAGRCAWRVLRRGPNDHDLVQVELIGPGRRHQIRAGLAFFGHPLLGDTLYGGAASQQPGVALHAWQLTIEEALAQAPAPPRFGEIPATESD